MKKVVYNGAYVLFQGDNVTVPSFDGSLLTNLYSYFKFDGTAFDAVRGITASGTESYTTGIINNSLNCNGTSVEVHQTAWYGITPASAGDAWSVSVWCKLSTDANGIRPIVLAYYEYPPTFHLDPVEMGCRFNAYKAQIYAKGAEYYRHCETTTSYNDNNWHHYVFVWESDEIPGYGFYSYGTIYVDGVVSVSKTSIGPFFSHADTLLIGTDYLNGAHMKGAIDEVAVWERALTSAEASSLYNLGKGLPFS